MLYEIDWWLAKMPTRAELEAHLAEICALAGLPPAAIEPATELGYEIAFVVPVQRAPYIPEKLANEGWPLEAVLEHMHAPVRTDFSNVPAAEILELPPYPSTTDGGPARSRRYVRGDAYEVVVTLHAGDDADGDDFPPELCVSTDNASNEDAWPVAEVLALALAERVGIHVDDEGRDDADFQIGWAPPPPIVVKRS